MEIPKKEMVRLTTEVSQFQRVYFHLNICWVEDASCVLFGLGACPREDSMVYP